ncbi:helix-turn-helix transcriptional regulator [Salinibacterium sp. G-O1]|uniref:helix-turn-helix domain-containing protein n=1 Tax=Salinibacterium sp. G-O1 TaxID=3046208 RepID=UPI0024B96EE6|nr:helix-turn-helix transcriptional regulator [Salinibacterium sp. G-O1]MDJ0336424.1 helix-turn-helix transcriptional regulator [Salinibacterium sp. G-O1]
MTSSTEAKEPPAIGRRVAGYRKMQALTAAQLAEAIPNEAITRSLIANIESGRKRDLTSSEVVLIASGLRISPLALLIDTDDPYGKLPYEGMGIWGAGISVAEYVTLSNLDDVTPRGFARLPHPAWALMRALVEAETTLDHIAVMESARNDPDIQAEFKADPEKHQMFWTSPLVSFGLTADSLTEETLHDRRQDLVTAYRNLLGRLPEWGTQFGSSPSIPRWIQNRIDTIRREVASVLRQDPSIETKATEYLSPSFGEMERVYGPAIDDAGKPYGPPADSD